MRTIASTILFATVLLGRAEAQELTLAVSHYSSFGLNDLDGRLPVSGELRFSLPISDRFALEPFVTAGSEQGGRRAGSEGFYGAQIRQRLRRLTSPSRYAFVTYGAAGYYSTSGAYPPVIGFFGVGMQQRISNRVSFRPEVQLISFHVVPIGYRFVAGVAVH